MHIADHVKLLKDISTLAKEIENTHQYAAQDVRALGALGQRSRPQFETLFDVLELRTWRLRCAKRRSGTKDGLSPMLVGPLIR